VTNPPGQPWLGRGARSFVGLTMLSSVSAALGTSAAPPALEQEQARRIAAEAGRSAGRQPEKVAVHLEPRTSPDPLTGRMDIQRQFFQAEPIRFSLRVRSPAAIQAFQRAENMGQRGVAITPVHVAPLGRSWSEFVTTRFYRKQTAGDLEVLKGFDWRTSVRRAFARHAAVTDIATNRIAIPVTLPPDASASLAPGAYAAEVVFDNSAAGAGVTWRGRVRSEPQERAHVLARQAGYAADQNDWAVAERLARQATTTAPAYPGGWTALGRSLGGTNKPLEAIEAYGRVVALLENSKAEGHRILADDARAQIGILRKSIGNP
jgi:hypothetical protein